MDIYIAPEKILTQYEGGFQVYDFPLLVGTHAVPLDDGNYSDLNENIIFYIKRWYGWAPLFLPTNFESAVRKFLREYHALQDEQFDCYAFASLAAELPLHSKEYLIHFWDIKKAPIWGIVGQQFIFLADERRRAFGHAALHIGQGHFLSVQGGGGTLSVSTLPDLRKMYQYFPDVLVATPRKMKRKS